MDANNVFADLTWDNVVIKHGALKSIQEYPVKELKHKDLHTVCSWLKIKGVKNTLHAWEACLCLQVERKVW